VVVITGPQDRGRDRARTYTLVAFHAHPDDESLLTGGTLARAAADGHRVVLVVATCGERGLAGPADGEGATLAALRMRELHEAARILGCARVVPLGFGDSGLHPDPLDPHAFVNVDVPTAAARLAEVLTEEHADVLVVYDRNGGYGHPDHVQVHRVGTLAAAEAGTPVVLEATVPGRLFRAVLLVLRAVGDALGSSSPLPTGQVFAPPGSITHRVRVTGSLSAKRAAMGAHGSQTRAEGRTRVLARLLDLPRPLYALAFGHEWYIEQGRAAGALQGDVFDSVREPRTTRDERTRQ
jgi:LmbE family N-acetylglucosaminyl deacetylase